MAVFYVTSLKGADRIGAIVSERFGTDSLEIQPGQWLVAYKGTSQQLSDELGISDGSIGSCIIFAISGYWGRAPTSIWEWLKSNWE